MGRAPIDVSRRVAGFLRQRRQELGWSLRQVEERAAALGVRLPSSTLVRIEQGKLDPGVRRLYTLIHVYNAELLADAMELGALAGTRIPRGDLETLTERGESAWMAGDIGDALAHALAVRDHEARDARGRRLKVRALIAFATYARNMGKFRLARQLADDLLRQTLELADLVDVLVLAASIWWGLGSSEAALALVERAAKRVGEKDLLGRARVEHQWARLLLDVGQAKEALSHLDRADDLYLRGKNAYNALQARSLRVKVLKALGRGDEALSCARQVLEDARKADAGRLTADAYLELGKLFLERGEKEAALEELRRGLASAVVLGDRPKQALAHARLWKAYLAAGEESAAGIELRHAQELAATLDDHAPELEEVRQAGGTEAGRRRPRATLARTRPATRRTVN